MWIAFTVALLVVVMFLLFLPAMFMCACGAPVSPTTTPIAFLGSPA